MKLRATAAAVALLCSVSACGPSIARRDASMARPTPTPVSVGSGIVITTPSPAPATASGGPLFVLQLTDPSGRHPQGIPVRLEGAQNGTVLSDRAGEVRIDRPGTYKATVAVGCQAGVFVIHGGGVSFGAVAGRSARGTIPVTWKHRAAPAAPVFTDVDGDWPVGRKVTVTFSVSDRCSSERVPHAEYPTYMFVPSANVKIVATPPHKADDRGQGRVVVSCTQPGKIGLAASDRTNPSDIVDLLAYATGYRGVPRCAAN